MPEIETPIGKITFADWPYRVIYLINSEVVEVVEEFKPAYVIGSGIGKDAEFVNQSLGWFVYLKGSHEALHLGPDKPTLAKGDKVKITVEKVI